jgi:hypothetical protein
LSSSISNNINNLENEFFNQPFEPLIKAHSNANVSSFENSISQVGKYMTPPVNLLDMKNEECDILPIPKLNAQLVNPPKRPPPPIPTNINKLKNFEIFGIELLQDSLDGKFQNTYNGKYYIKFGSLLLGDQLVSWLWNWSWQVTMTKLV